MTKFTAVFLDNPHPEPVELFVIPALAQSATQRLPFLSLVKCLSDDKFYCRRLINDSWLLHSVLSLEPPQFSECCVVLVKLFYHILVVLGLIVA